MRILFILSQDIESPSGLGRYFPMARGLVNLGHQVEIIALHSNYNSLKSTSFIREGVHVSYLAQMHVYKIGNSKHYFTTPQLLRNVALSTFRLTVEALRRSADIIHIGKPHPMNGIGGAIASRIRRTPVFLDCDDYEASSNRFSHKWQSKAVSFFEDQLPKWVNGVTTNTHFNRVRIMDLGVPEDQIMYIPNAVDQIRFKKAGSKLLDQTRRALGLLKSQPAIFYIGSLSLINHPVNLLIEAFILVKEQYQNAKLIIVGSGDDYVYLRDLASSMEYKDDIVFVGHVSPGEVVRYYQLADVTVDPVYDNPVAKARNPLKIAESLYMGIPVVTGSVGDRKRYKSDHVILIEPGSALSLAGGIVKALSSTFDPQVRDNPIPQSWDDITRQLHSFYERQI